MTDLLPTAADPGTTVRLTVRTTPAGVTGRGPLRLDWSVRSGTADRQVGYEIQAAPTPDFAAGVARHRPRRRAPASWT